MIALLRTLAKLFMLGPNVVYATRVAPRLPRCCQNTRNFSNSFARSLSKDVHNNALLAFNDAGKTPAQSPNSSTTHRNRSIVSCRGYNLSSFLQRPMLLFHGVRREIKWLNYRIATRRVSRRRRWVISCTTVLNRRRKKPQLIKHFALYVAGVPALDFRGESFLNNGVFLVFLF